MKPRDVSRRSLLQGGAALAGLAALHARLPAQAATRPASGALAPWLARSPLALADFPARPGEDVIPWLDQPPPNPVPEAVGTLLQWEELDSWITPNDKFFTVQHYNKPVIAPEDWRLEVTGLVNHPLTVTLDDLTARPSVDLPFTLECSGNNGFPWFIGGIGNAIWTGTPLAPLLEEAGVLAEGIEVVFWGTDTGPEVVRDLTLTEQFARSLSITQAMDPNILLCYAMNGEPLPQMHGGPVRLITPSRFGVANVKWLQRIEILDTRYEGRFMGRDYVTIRTAEQAGTTVARFTSVGKRLLKSAPAKVTQLDGDYRIIGAAWGAPIAAVEVQIDGGDWLPATLEEGAGVEFAWSIWSLDWGQPSDGLYSITSRAIDTDGNIQPAPDDPVIANKLTYWESNGQITRYVALGAPGGVVLPGASVLAASLSGANEVPGPGDADGFGYAQVVINPAAESVCFRISVAGIDVPTAAHIHAGAAGVAGAVVVPLLPVDASGLWDGCVTVDAVLAADIVTNPSAYYVNVHTAAYPAGALRGQLGPTV